MKIIITSLLLLSILFGCETTKTSNDTTSIFQDTLQLKNDFLTVKVKTFGAELISIQSNQDQQEYLWQGDTISWQDHAIVQFPIVCNVKDDKYTFEGKEYEIMSHGFGRVSQYTVDILSDTSVILSIQSDENTKKMYPFDFTYAVSYTLINNKVNVSFDIKNSGSKEMFYSSGYHPGFNCPLDDNATFSDYQLSFEKEETIESLTLEKGMVTSQKRPFLNANSNFALTKKAFEQDVFILEKPSSKTVSINKINATEQDKSVVLTFGDVPYLGIWSPSNESPFVCIEPWFGLPDDEGDRVDFNEKKAIRHLQPNDKFQWDFAMEFR
ncbi:aldose 1-epimerase family protein [Flammeovirga agarivorans]|uniref:Aldose 1-epimerase family protein n=1 Tax=Flammeovirga agarivorans TaxID=2726742 RepID=A0A7X8SGQ3_9BACT|nr:aldose 1-epimerase family protein [Flammeovirga agarivorans]NLR89940.1 aldose 1-epimerase family protein [Flammeovirga agarivorans]